MKYLLILFSVFCLATACKAQQKPEYDRTRTQQVLSDYATRSRYYIGIPSGTTPGFPSYVPDSIKCGALYNKITLGHADTLMSYDCNSGTWKIASGANYTASNGITKTGNNFTLNGDLTGNTTINANGYNFGLVLNKTNDFSGYGGSDIILNGNNLYGTNVTKLAFNGGALGVGVNIGDYNQFCNYTVLDGDPAPITIIISDYPNVSLGVFTGVQNAVYEVNLVGDARSNGGSNNSYAGWTTLTPKWHDDTGAGDNPGVLPRLVLQVKQASAGSGVYQLRFIRRAQFTDPVNGVVASSPNIKIYGNPHGNITPTPVNTGTQGNDATSFSSFPVYAFSYPTAYNDNLYDSSGNMYLKSNGTLAWSSITGKPTTISGYGITDAVTLTGTQTLTNKDLTSGTNTFPTFNQNTTGSAAKWTTARSLAGNSVDGSANVAFTNKFIVQGTSDAGLTGAQFLGALATGIVKNTTTTGVLSIAIAGTDYQAPLNGGTGFVKSTSGTISYDNSTYLTTSSAASTYLPLAGGTLTGTLTSQSVVPDANGTRSLGSSSFKWGSVNANNVNASQITVSANTILGADGDGGAGQIIYHGGGAGNTGTISISAPGTGTITSYAFNWPRAGASNTTSALTWGGSGLPLTWTDLSTYALLASPVFTGNPTAPTAATSDSSKSVATTEYVKKNFQSTITYFTPGMFSGSGTAGSNYNWGTATIPVSALSATGTADGSHFLAGDNTWKTISSGFTNPMTTQGDLIKGGASGAATRVALGSASQVLGVNTGATDVEYKTISGSGGVTFTPGSGTLAFSIDQTFAPTWTGIHTFSTTNTASSGASTANYGTYIHHTVNQTGTAGFTDLYVNRVNTAPGSGSHFLAQFAVGGSTVLSINTSGGLTLSSSITSNGSFTANQFSTSGTYTNDGLYLYNSATAASGTPSLNSLRSRYMASVWNTTATAAANYAFMYNELRTTSGTTPTYAMYWAANLSTTTTMGTASDIASLDNAGNYKAYKSIGSAEITFANRPASPYVGMVCNFSDSTVSTFGGSVAGSGTNHVSARWNGTNWTVTGI